ncbi:MAG: glycosyltransferase [Planctomycetota bacterium]|nr:MAG: glycosyltransferase [Planctomycetota bacterium]
MRWAVAAPFTADPASDRWLTPFVRGGRHSFVMVPAPPRPSWHARAQRASGWLDWLGTWSQGRTAWAANAQGVITVFPQLAFSVGARQRARAPQRLVVAWCFNLGQLYGGVKRAAARLALARVDRFVVHSRAEVALYAEWLELPQERFRFVPLQRAAIPLEEVEEQRDPFVLAMGSAQRDYATLFEAVRGSRRRTIVVAAAHALAGLDVPANVEVRRGLTAAECRRLAQRARVNVVPVRAAATAAGQVTLVEALRMGRAVVATRCSGSVDYVAHERTGLLVEPHSAAALRDAIERLWADADLRADLGRNAARHAQEHCSDEAAGVALRGVLDELVGSGRACRS